MIEQAASTDENRYILNGVFYDPQEGVCVATDGRYLARIPVEVEDDARDNPVIIPSSAFKDHRKARRLKKFEELEFAPREKEIAFDVEHGSQTAVSVEGNYPRYKQVLPDWEGVLTHTFSFNPKYLQRLANALGSPECVTLTVAIGYFDEKYEKKHPADHVIEVRPADHDKTKTIPEYRKKLGVLMPLRVIK